MKSSVGEVRSQFGPVGLIGKTARVIADRMRMTISTEGYINGQDVINRVFFKGFDCMVCSDQLRRSHFRLVMGPVYVYSVWQIAHLPLILIRRIAEYGLVL